MTESQARDVKYAAAGGALLVVTVVAWPYLKNVLALLKTVGSVGSSIASKTDAVIHFLSGSCGFGQGDCQNPSHEAQMMRDRISACASRPAKTRTNDQGGSLNPCFPDTDHTDMGANFTYDPAATAQVPVALPPAMRTDEFLWGPRFQFQLNGWRAALAQLGILQLYSGELWPQCEGYGNFIKSRAMGDTGTFDAGGGLLSSPCNSVYFNGGAQPRPFEAKINKWMKSQGF
jgi:hypothetical protein